MATKRVLFVELYSCSAFHRIIDIEPMSGYCRECSVNTRKLQDGGKALEIWNDRHQMKCKLNHQGSSPAMEPVGAEQSVKSGEAMC